MSHLLTDIGLLRAATVFLLRRRGFAAVGIDEPDIDIETLFAAESCEAYGASGRSAIGEFIRSHGADFPSSLVSITANAPGRLVRVDYGAAMEVLRFGLGGDGQTVINKVECIGGDEDSGKGPILARLATSWVGDGQSFTGVELLWWAVRFLVADLTQDYEGQARWLHPDAAAFGEQGRDAVVTSNKANAETGVTYTVPYPLTVDEKFRKVVLPFDAWRSGELAYRGTDIYELSEVSDPPGLMQRIITVNHSDCKCWSAE